MSRLRKLLALPAAERHALLAAAALLPIVRLGLWILPFGTLRRLLAVSERLHPLGPQRRRPGPDCVAWAVGVVSRYLLRTSSCLTQALTAQLLLRWHGYPAVVRIGVTRTEEAPFRAHAWVESEGRVVFGGARPSQFTPLPALQ